MRMPLLSLPLLAFAPLPVPALAQDQGKRPIEAIASLLQAYGITPQQYAQSVTQNPQAHQIAPQAPRDPMITMLAQQQQQIMQRREAQLHIDAGSHRV